MAFEGMFGPKSLAKVPNERTTLDASAYEKKPLAERLAFTPAESAAYQDMLRAGSVSELRAAIDAFNGVSVPKKAEALGISLDELEIRDEPVSLGAIHDLPDDAQVVAYRDMREGITRFRIADAKGA